MITSLPKAMRLASIYKLILILAKRHYAWHWSSATHPSPPPHTHTETFEKCLKWMQTIRCNICFMISVWNRPLLTASSPPHIIVTTREKQTFFLWKMQKKKKEVKNARRPMRIYEYQLFAPLLSKQWNKLLENRENRAWQNPDRKMYMSLKKKIDFQGISGSQMGPYYFMLFSWLSCNTLQLIAKQVRVSSSNVHSVEFIIVN